MSGGQKRVDEPKPGDPTNCVACGEWIPLHIDEYEDGEVVWYLNHYDCPHEEDVPPEGDTFLDGAGICDSCSDETRELVSFWEQDTDRCASCRSEDGVSRLHIHKEEETATYSLCAGCDRIVHQFFAGLSGEGSR